VPRHERPPTAAARRAALADYLRHVLHAGAYAILRTESAVLPLRAGPLRRGGRHTLAISAAGRPRPGTGHRPAPLRPRRTDPGRRSARRGRPGRPVHGARWAGPGGWPTGPSRRPAPERTRAVAPAQPAPAPPGPGARQVPPTRASPSTRTSVAAACRRPAPSHARYGRSDPTPDPPHPSWPPPQPGNRPACSSPPGPARAPDNPRRPSHVSG
jgi:hypothetical protein